MQTKKLTALFCVLTLLLSIFTMPASADEAQIELFAAETPSVISTVTKTGASYMVKPTKTTNILWDNFEDGDTSDWYFRNDNNAGARKAEVLEVDGNRFLRFSLDGAYPVTYDKVNEQYPVLSRSFAEDGAIAIDMSNVSVFEMDFRTSAIESDVNKVMLINYPYPGEKLPDGTTYTRFNAGYSENGWNTRTHFRINNGDGKAKYAYKSAWGGGGNQGSLEDIATLSANQWYKVRYVYNNAASPRTISAYIYTYNADGSLNPTPVKKENKEITAWWLTHYDMGTEAGGSKFPITNHEIYDFSFRFGMPNNQSRTANIDIDNLRYFAQKPVVNTSVSANTDIGILYKPTEVSLYFDAPINYVDGGIEIHDSLNNVIAHSGTYDEATRTYTAVFDSQLAGGDYNFVLTNAVSPLNVSEGKVASIVFNNTQIAFKSYDAMPPSALNVEIEGRVIPGTALTADYDFASEAETEGTSVFKWYASTTGAEGSFSAIPGQSEKTLDVTQAGVYGKYIQFSVTPVSNSGLEGQEYFSNIIISEVKPVIDNLRLSAQTLFPESYITPLYEYSDLNDDTEEGTEFVWYASNDGVSDWNLVSTEEKYHITNDDLGLYLKCVVTPKNGAQCEGVGTAYESEAAGPVSDLLEVTNLFEDPSFENTSIGDVWVYDSVENVWKGASITNTDARTGNYSLRQPPRKNLSDSWGQAIPITEGNVYLLGAYAKKSNDKLADTDGLWPYVTTDNAVTRYDSTQSDYQYVVTRRWQLCAGTFLATASKNARFGFLSFETIDTLDAMFDDMYVGELLIGDIETFEPGDITIPQVGETSVTIASGRVLNQLRTTHGLVDQAPQYELPEDSGMYIEDGKLIVTNRAKAGRYNIRIFCEPSYPGADQDVFEKYVTVNLLPNNDASPKAYDVTANGNVANGSTIIGDYKFYQIDSKADASTFQWIYCDTEDGIYEPIPGAEALTYTVESAYADKYIKFSVTPKTDDGMVGEAVYSNFVTNPRVPVASDIIIDGDFNVGGTVTAQYTFYDPNGDDEADTDYEWMIADAVNSSFAAISGASGKSLVLTEEMIGKYIKVAVQPKSAIAPAVGVKVYSDAVIGPATPQAKNISIENNNGRLKGHYIYSHPHNMKEQGTTFAWKVDGATVSNEISYVPSFSGVKTVTFTVTPKCEGNPSSGNSVSVSVTIGNANSGVMGGITGGFVGGGSSSGGSYGGGGGGGASSGSGTGVTNINDMTLVDPNAQPETPKTDIDEHWGKEYIEEMAKRGVMTPDENGNYNPDVNVTREEMVTFLFDALGLESSTYENQFGDVEEGEFANKLQTMLNNGTISKDTSFRPDDTISREEMCKILYVSLENAGKLAEVEEGLINSFADYDGISEWARVYVNAIYGNKIMVGVSDAEFDAQGTVTKAQAATMLVRILALTEGE